MGTCLFVLPAQGFVLTIKVSQDITHYSPLEGESASHGREPVGAPVGEIKRRHRKVEYE